VIILDTNVISEIIRAEPSPAVMNWMESQSRAMLFTTTLTRAELLYGMAILPDSPRKMEKERIIKDILNIDFHEKMLPFDKDAADCYAEITAVRKKSGSPISQFDAMIAAITQSRGAKLATRNIKDFIHCGISIINPWNTVS